MSLLRTLPDWRVSLVWRLYGWAVVQEMLVLCGARPWERWFGESPFVLQAMSLCGLLLLVLGPRPLVLAATAVFATAWGWITAAGLDPRLDFPGAELPVFVTLPAGSVVLILLGGARGRSAEDLSAALLGLYRLTFVVEMAFATLHKVNVDFLDPTVSCAGALNHLLPERWDSVFASLAWLLTPPVVLFFEAVSPVLAILYWPLGLLVLLGFVLGLAMIGPTGFTAVTVSAAFSFVRGTTAEEFYRLPRGHPWWCVIAGAGLVAYVFVSHRAPPSYPWGQYALYVLVVGFLAACLGGEIARDLRGGRPGGIRSVLVFGWPRPSRFRAALVLFGLLLVANGLTPYTGYRYHFSFSMLSNLRADQMRWNSYVFPRWLRLVDEDPFVEVTKVRIRRRGGRATDPDRELFEAHFPPYEFVRRVDYHLGHGHEVYVWIRYEGREHALLGVGRNPEARAFLDGLPRAQLFQKVLVKGPQPCVH